jgi:hypothetical protein
MATNVIHGTGKPIINITTNTILGSSTSPYTGYTIKGLTGSNLIVEIDPATASLASLNTQYGLVNYLIYSFTSSDVLTWAKIESYTETGSDYLTVDGWHLNNVPAVGKPCWIKNVWVELPYCQRLTETWIPDTIVHKLYNGNIYRQKRGFYYAASLDYSSYAHKNTILLFKQLLKKDTGEIYFIPRADNLAIRYKVDLAPETEITLNQMQWHAGHRSFMINLIGVERLTEIQLGDSDASSGYGDDYGTDYGTGL